MAAKGGTGKPRKVLEPSVRELEALERSEPSTDAAAKEAVQLGSGLADDELARLAAGGEHRRSERFKDHFEHIAVSVLWIGGLALLAMAGTLIFHLLCPNKLRWISEHQQDKLEYLVAGGVVSGVVTAHLKKRIGW